MSCQGSGFGPHVVLFVAFFSHFRRTCLEKNAKAGYRIRVRKRLKREKRILDDDQLRALLVELPPEIGLMVQTAVSTGMRVSQIIG